MADLNPELESFRAKWRAEVTARSRAPGQPQPAAAAGSSESSPEAPASLSQRHAKSSSYDKEECNPGLYHETGRADKPPRFGDEGVSTSTPYASLRPSREPTSALEHFERAIEREDKGSLGESLAHYRKAYRLDPCIDKTYRAKHYPQTTPSASSQPNTAAPTTSTKIVSDKASSALQSHPTPLDALISSFSTVTLTPVLPEIPDSPPPTSPICQLPTELLLHILTQVLQVSPSDLCSLSLVCRRICYLLHTPATSSPLFRLLLSSPIHGLGSQHYHPACTISGNPIPSILSTTPRLVSLPLHPATPHTSYRDAFRAHPLIRFPGVYISTVNYVRPGAASQGQVSWNTPVLVVTYYRYLRCFRDGTALSLLTTTDPSEVVPHLTRDNVRTAQSGVGGPISSLVRGALRGRWWVVSSAEHAPPCPVDTHIKRQRSSTDVDPPAAAAAAAADGAEQDDYLRVETEGTNEKYMYRMELAIRPTGGARKAAGGRKLVWKSFSSYNHLTGDWAEFGLRNDRAFFWSRVRSYGTGD